MALKRWAIAIIVVCGTLASVGPAAPVAADVPPAWMTLNTAAFGSEQIVNIAVSPNYQQDKTIFAVTAGYTTGSVYYVWRTQDGALTWQRVLTAPNGVNLYVVAVSPDYGKNAQVVYMNAYIGTDSKLWRSFDAGTTWSVKPAPAGTGTSPFAVASDNIVFLSANTGAQSYVYSTSNGGFTYSAGTSAGNPVISMIAVSPTFAADQTLLVGNVTGGVLWSNDGGATLRLVSSVVIPGTQLWVAFDENFSVTRTVYAATDNTGGGIYSTNVGAGQPWQRIDTGLPSNEMLGGLVVSSSGALYALSYNQVNVSASQGGVLRCINPVASAVFERVNNGLTNGATLTVGVLPCVGNEIWAFDGDSHLVTFVDTLGQPVQLVSPVNNASNVGSYSAGSVSGVFLNWQPLDGAATYQWQISSSADFAVVPNGFSGISSGTQLQAPVLNQTSIYYWRVQAKSPMLGPWSAVWSFGTPSPPVQIEAPSLMAPLTAGTAVAPEFSWGVVTGAGGYELVVSKTSDFSSSVISRTGAQRLTAGPWQSAVTLEYSTAFYWRVRAIIGTVTGPWSSTGIFVTVPAPESTVTVTSTATSTATATFTPPVSTSQPPQSIAPGSTTPADTSVPPATAPGTSPPATDESTVIPPVVSPIPAATPDWVYYSLVGGAVGGALLLAVVLLLRGPRHPKLL